MAPISCWVAMFQSDRWASSTFTHRLVNFRYSICDSNQHHRFSPNRFLLIGSSVTKTKNIFAFDVHLADSNRCVLADFFHIDWSIGQVFFEVVTPQPSTASTRNSHAMFCQVNIDRGSSSRQIAATINSDHQSILLISDLCF